MQLHVAWLPESQVIIMNDDIQLKMVIRSSGSLRIQTASCSMLYSRRYSQVALERSDRRGRQDLGSVLQPATAFEFGGIPY